MNKLVVGFLFSPDEKYVVLIKKNRPKWQEGKYNGVGGHMNSNDETALQAMIRKFKEETGLEIIDWKSFAEGYNVDDNNTRVDFFVAKSEFYDTVTSKEDEHVSIIARRDLSFLPLIYNLNWLILLALDKQTTYTTFNFTLNNEVQP